MTTPPRPRAFHGPAPDNPASIAGLSPDLLVAATPHLIGFQPRNSLVLFALAPAPVGGAEVVATMRVDLPPAVDRVDFARWLTEPLSAAVERSDAFVLVTVTDDRDPDAAAVLSVVAVELSRVGAHVLDCLEVVDGRWRSTWCDDEACCSRRGARPTQATQRRAVRRFARQDRPPLASRQALEAELAVRQVRGTWPETADPIPPAAVEVAVTHAVSVLRAGEALSAADLVLLGTGLTDKRVRDTVMWDLLRVVDSGWQSAARVLTMAVREVPPAFVPPLATCLAIVRWQLGDGARASVALERALSVDPEYSLAQLVDRCVGGGLHPSEWLRGIRSLDRAQCSRVA
jgi:hypothetical protein